MNRQRLKKAVKSTFLVVTSPLFLICHCSGLVAGKDHAFQAFSQLLSLIPGRIGVYFRAAFYRLACPNTSDEISVGFLTVFSHRDVTIEQGVYIGPQCNIGKCTIGRNSLLGSGVHILSGANQHRFNDPSVPIQEQGGIYEKISIGEDCWLGNQALVMASLGNQSIVAAGSVVVKPGNPGDILAGNPSRLIRNRF